MRGNKGHQPSEKELANLRPFNKMPKEEHLRIASNGGKKAAENMRCADYMELLADKIYKAKNGSKANGREVLMVTLLNEGVKKGKIDAIKLILQLLGEMPTPELNINSNKDEKDNGMLEELLQANLEIQKKAMEEKGNGQTGTENTNADCELA